MVAVIGDLGTPNCEGPPTFTDSEGFELVTAAAGLVSFLYPANNPSPTLVEVYNPDPELAASRPPLLRSMKRLLAAIRAGLPTLRSWSPDGPFKP